LAIDPFSAKVQALVVDNVGSRVVGINETTRQGIASVIETGLGVDGDTRTIGDLSGAIRGMGLFDEARAEVIARTETQFAFNTAALTSYKEYGVEMVQAIDGDFDEVCAERNGKVMPVLEAQDIEDHPNGTLDWVPVRDDAEAQRLQREYEAAQAARVATSPTPIARTVEQESALMRTAYADWTASVSASEGSAFGEYYAAAYRPINGALRADGTVLSASDARTLDLIDNAIVRSDGLKHDITVWRGIAQEDLPGPIDDLVGGTFRDPAFASTSYDRNVAGKFASWKSDEGRTPLVMEVNVPAGTPSALVEAVARTQSGTLISDAWPMEGEILLGHGVQFEVTGVSEGVFTVYGEPQTIRVIKVTVVR
jgi:hypothetical protein